MYESIILGSSFGYLGSYISLFIYAHSAPFQWTLIPVLYSYFQSFCFYDVYVVLCFSFLLILGCHFWESYTFINIFCPVLNILTILYFAFNFCLLFLTPVPMFPCVFLQLWLYLYYLISPLWELLRAWDGYFNIPKRIWFLYSHKVCGKH